MSMEHKRIRSSYTIHSPVILSAYVPTNISGQLTHQVNLPALHQWKQMNNTRFFQHTKGNRHNMEQKSTEASAGESTGSNSEFNKKRVRKKSQVQEEENSDRKKKEAATFSYMKKPSLRKAQHYRYKKHGTIRHAELSHLIAKKGMEGFHSPEGDLLMGNTVKRIRYTNGAEVRYQNKKLMRQYIYKKKFSSAPKATDRQEIRLWNDKGSVNRHTLSEKDKITLAYPIGKKKDVEITMSRTAYMHMMDRSAKGLIRTYSGDVIRGFGNETKAFVHSLPGRGVQGYSSQLRHALDKNGTLASDSTSQMLAMPYQIKEVKHTLQQIKTAGHVSGRLVKAVAYDAPKQVIKGAVTVSRKAYSAGKGAKKFAKATRAQKKKMVQQAANQAAEAAAKTAKKAVKKAAQEIGSMLIKALGTMLGGSAVLVIILLIPMIFLLVSLIPFFMQKVATYDGDSILAMNDNTTQWETATKNEIADYTDGLKQDIECPFDRCDKSCYFIVEAGEMDKIDGLWNSDIEIADEDDKINADPDVEGTVESWDLLEAEIANAWMPVYALANAYFNYDTGNLGGNNADAGINGISKAEILAKAKEFYTIMFDSLLMTKSITLKCHEEYDEPYDADGDGIEETTTPVTHEHAYTYYAVFAGVRGFEETLSCMPWHTDTYNYCMRYEEDFKTMTAEEQGRYMANLPEQKDRAAREFYAELMYSMASSDEDAAEENVNTEWKDLLNIRSPYDGMTTEEFIPVYNTFPVIQMTRAEFVELVKDYCEPTGKIPYLFGGKCTSPGWNSTVANGLDCTGFADWIYRTAGKEVLQSGPGEMWYATYSIQEENLLPGDLVWKSQPYESAVTHVGIFLGYDEDGNKLFGHCAGGTGTIINSYEGFTFFRRACVRFLDDLDSYEPESSSS